MAALIDDESGTTASIEADGDGWDQKVLTTRCSGCSADSNSNATRLNAAAS